MFITKSMSYPFLRSKLHSSLGLKTTNISHNFCGSEIQTQLSWCLCLKVSHKTAIMLARAEISYESYTAGSIPELTCLLAERIQPLRLRASALHWLLAESLAQFLAQWVSP